MLIIQDIAVHDSVAHTMFACDLNACKGACCTFPGGRGAPLRDEEVFEIEKAFPFVEAMLPPNHLQTIGQHELVDGYPGNYSTQCVDGKACVFVFYDGGIAKCAIEKAYFDGKITFRKPISCHLFPVRVHPDGNAIHFEYFGECEPALKRGTNENVPLHRFVRDSLEREFGTPWTQQLSQHIDKEISR